MPFGSAASPVRLLDAQQARAGDEAAVAAGDTWSGLMARAAEHLAHGVVRVAGRHDGLRVAILAGKGNNGGDGWAAATLLRDMGCAVTVVSLAPLDAPLSEEATAHRSAWLDTDGSVTEGPDAVGEACGSANVVVDCLLGTGSTGAPRGNFATACVAVQDARAADPALRVVACDVPTGVSSDSGEAPGPAIRADATVTFGGVKRGLVLHPGADLAGRILVGDLGPDWTPPADGADGRPWWMVTARTARPPRLSPEADKRSRGTVLVIAGSVGQAGAAILATRGALAAGAGLVTLATPAHVQRVIAPVVPSAMTRPLRHASEHVSADAVDQLTDADEFDAVVVGPGLGPTPGTRAVVDHLRATARCLVVDADAINVHRDDPAVLADHAGHLVLTPHARELARLGGGTDGHDAWANRLDRVPRLAAEFDATILAKGPGTMVAGPDGECWVCPVGGPELGTGGSGDVLAGMLGAALARHADATATPGPTAPSTSVAQDVATVAFWHAFTGAWLAAGRTPSEQVAHAHLIADHVGDLGGATVAGFGPSSALPDALPDALRVLAMVADRQPHWPLEVPW